MANKCGIVDRGLPTPAVIVVGHRKLEPVLFGTSGKEAEQENRISPAGAGHQDAPGAGLAAPFGSDLGHNRILPHPTAKQAHSSRPVVGLWRVCHATKLVGDQMSFSM